MNNKIFIIAEAGVNHNGERDMAFQLVDEAIKAGADAVKFQTFKAENLVIKSAIKAAYQEHTTDASESQFDMLKSLELDYKTYIDLKRYCVEKGIEFLSTAFDLESLDFLVNKICLRTLKVPSGEITNGPLILEHAYTGCDLIVSTGMATILEIEEALGVIAFGFIQKNNSSVKPSITAFREAYNSIKGKEILRKKVTLLHCTSEYPAPARDINLNAMCSMHNIFGIKVGYSDHSEGISVPIAAGALGASIIEKHFTLDRTLPGPDHNASLEPNELKAMVDSIRIIEQAIGDGVKEPMPSEKNNRNIVRKSLIAETDIAEGEVFNKDNLAIKRPGTGISPMEYWSFLGTKSNVSYKAEDIIK